MQPDLSLVILKSVPGFSDHLFTDIAHAVAIRRQLQVLPHGADAVRHSWTLLRVPKHKCVNKHLRNEQFIRKGNNFLGAFIYLEKRRKQCLSITHIVSIYIEGIMN